MAGLPYSTKFWRGEILRFWPFPARPSNYLKKYSIYRYVVKGRTICQNIFHQIFEGLVIVKISPIKILRYIYCTFVETEWFLFLSWHPTDLKLLMATYRWWNELIHGLSLKINVSNVPSILGIVYVTTWYPLPLMLSGQDLSLLCQHNFEHKVFESMKYNPSIIGRIYLDTYIHEWKVLKNDQYNLIKVTIHWFVDILIIIIIL